MLAIITNIENWTGEFLLGQIDNKVILEVESIPTKIVDEIEVEIECEDITNKDITFIQRFFDGKYGKCVTYQKFCETRNLINEVGESDSYEGLLKKKIDLQSSEILDNQIALIESYEKSLELEAMQVEADLALVEQFEKNMTMEIKQLELEEELDSTNLAIIEIYEGMVL